MDTTRLARSRSPHVRVPEAGLASRFAALAYGIICYVAFLATLAYTFGFLGGFDARTIDHPVRSPPATALTIDVLLLTGFALQHSIMARPGFKRCWAKLVPTPLERSTYVLLSSAALGVLFWQWQPVDQVVWQVRDSRGRVALNTLFLCGWLLLLAATAMINHADLFGLRQTWYFFRGRRYFPPNFVAPGPYALVRHPLYLGWIIAFWATPEMTSGHAVFAAGMTAYIRIAITLEERDLIAEHGRKYRKYRQSVPRLLPFAPVRREPDPPRG